MARSSGSSSDPKETVGVLVKNLPSKVRSKDLAALFSRCGTVVEAEVTLNRQKRSTGVGTVRYDTPAEAERAIRQFNEFFWQSRILEVEAEEASEVHSESDDGSDDTAHGHKRSLSASTVSSTEWVTDSEEESGSRTPTMADNPWGEPDKNPFRSLAFSSQKASSEPTTPIHPYERPTQPGPSRHTIYSSSVDSTTGSRPQSSMFSNASEMTFDGTNSFSSVGRDRIHIEASPTFVINSDSSTSPSSSVLAQSTSSINSSAPASSPASVTGKAEHPSETYARLLLPKKHGWPLWSPIPRESLPEPYRKRGVDIGDVGIVTAAGEFDFFFNICLPADDPINRNLVPEGFVHINHPQNNEDVCFDREEWRPGEVIGDANHPHHYHFLASAPEGALLLLPKGASRRDLLNTEPFIAYAKKHGLSWYQHIKVTRGRNAINGTVYLITGVDKTQVWGTGMYSQPSSHATRNTLTFEKAPPGFNDDKYEYVWTQTHFGSSKLKYGPSREFFDGRTELPHNQCAFMRGFRVAVNESIWRSLFGVVVDVSSIQDASVESLLQKGRDFSPNQSTFSNLSSYFGFHTSSYGTSATSRASGGQAGEAEEPVTVISEIPAPSMTLHPSDMINRYLLSQYNKAEIAITHDDIWCSILDKDAAAFPDSATMLARIEDKYEIGYSDGGVSLLLKSNSGASSSSTTPRMNAKQLHPEPDLNLAPSSDPTAHDLGIPFPAVHISRDRPHSLMSSSIFSESSSDLSSITGSDRNTLFSFMSDDRASTVDTILEPAEDEGKLARTEVTSSKMRTRKSSFVFPSRSELTSLSRRLFPGLFTARQAKLPNHLQELPKTPTKSTSDSPHVPDTPLGHQGTSPPRQLPEFEILPDDYETFFCRVLYDFASKDTSVLHIRRGDIIEVITQQPSGWWDGVIGNERGWFPSNYVQRISEEEAETAMREVLDRSKKETERKVFAEGPTNMRQEHINFWIPQVTPNGQIYYANTITGEESQDLPNDFENSDVEKEESDFNKASKSLQAFGSPSQRHFQHTVVDDQDTRFLTALDDSSGLLFDSNGTIRGGTLNALVNKLTAPGETDATFAATFLMTFKSFTTIDGLFDCLSTRFEMQPPDNVTPDQRKAWIKNTKEAIQSRVVDILELLVNNQDIFEESDRHILTRVSRLAYSRDERDERDISYADVLYEARLSERLRSLAACQLLPSDGNIALSAPTTQTSSPQLSLKNSKKLKLLDIDPLELARQLTIVESRLYAAITSTEWLHRATKQRKENQDHIAELIRTSNQIADWVAEMVLSKDMPRKRAIVVKYFITVADHCRRLNNFSSAIAITSGLTNPPIRRLKRTWEFVSRNAMSQLAACEKVFESHNTFSKYKHLTASLEPPCIPFTGIFLSTLMFVQDGMPDDLAGGFINFKKRQKFFDVISEAKRWQAQPFNFKPVQTIQEYLKESMNNPYDSRERSDQFWAISIQLEPKEREDEKMARLLEETGFL